MNLDKERKETNITIDSILNRNNATILLTVTTWDKNHVKYQNTMDTNKMNSKKSDRKLSVKLKKCSWSYMCDFDPRVEDDEEGLEPMMQKSLTDPKLQSITWTDPELVEKVRSICPRWGVVDRLLFFFFGKCKCKRQTKRTDWLCSREYS